MSTSGPEKPLKNDGSIVKEVVKSVAVAAPGVAGTNRAFDTGTRIFTIKSFLSANAVYVVIEGALHGFTPCVACERTPGQYSNTVRNVFDYIQKWTNARFQQPVTTPRP